MKNKMIVLMGGQGVGKGTFAKILREEHNYNYIETGAMLRSLPADSEIAKIMARGELVPDEMFLQLVADKLSQGGDILMDGFPRTLAQAQWLIESYAEIFDIHVLYLNVPEDIMLARIQKRINQGGGRADDADAAAVRRRLDTFWKTTMPAIEWLKTVSNIHFSDLDVTGTVDENMAVINKALAE